MLRSDWSLINIAGTMGVGPNKLLVMKGSVMDLGRAIAGFPQQILVGTPSTQGRAKIGANKFNEAMNFVCSSVS